MKRTIISIAAILACICASAQDDSRGWSLEAEAGAGTSFYWGGLTHGGLQLTGNVYYGYSFSEDFFLGANLYGTSDFGLSTAPKFNNDPESYSCATLGLSGGFKALTFDLLWERYPEADNYMTLELGWTLSEAFPLTLDIYTVLLGEGDKGEDGRACFSTLLSASYGFCLFERRLTLSPTVEYTPWYSPFVDEHERCHWNFLGVKAEWGFLEGRLPLGVVAGWNPTFRSPALMAGISFSL